MHKFIDNIVAFSLKNKFFIFFCTAIAVIAGAVSFKHTPIDAFPDVTNTKVTIITQWPGRSAEEVEKFITIPVEIAMNPVQKKTDIRSTTLFGLSVINVMFEDRVDDFTARQQVYNLLNDADLPDLGRLPAHNHQIQQPGQTDFRPLCRKENGRNLGIPCRRIV